MTATSNVIPNLILMKSRLVSEFQIISY